MIIDRNLTPYMVFAEDPIIVALRKMTANKERIVFVVDASGVLLGVLTDGDFRRWVINAPDIDFDVPVLDVANRNPATSRIGVDEKTMREALPNGAMHLPLLDDRGHVMAIAIDRSDELRIGERRIGPGFPAYVIAEIGNNHNGDVDLAKRLVDLAADLGADAVKFQLRDMDSLYRQSGGATEGEDLAAQYTLDLLRKFSLPAEELFAVFDHCRDRGIEVFCTPWDHTSVEDLAAYGVPAFKIASADLTNHELLKDVGSRSIPTIVSTGMSSETEIRESIEVLKNLGTPFALLHCQSMYPAPFKDVNLAYMDKLAEIGECPVGYSGHERGIHVPIAAVARGASIIEKHFTIDKTMEGNDHQVSLLPEEFEQMVRQIREVEEAIGKRDTREVTHGEKINRINLAKSLVAARPITTGQRISAEDVTIKSPGRGLQPNRLTDLVGRRAHRDLQAGDFFFAGDLDDAMPTGRDFTFRRPWGLPVRYHDALQLLQHSSPDFLEFHFSYKDLDIDPADVFDKPLDIGFTTHLPDLFAGDFLVDLASRDEAHWRRSIDEVQRTIDVTRELKKYFPKEERPIMVVTMGGFTMDGHIPPSERIGKYDRITEAVGHLDTDGIRMLAQTLPPYPWLLGGQQYHNLFMDPDDTIRFCEDSGVRLCLDISHSKLSANWLGIPFSEMVEKLAPYSDHLHIVDASGVDGEGDQVGEGEVDWPVLAEQLDRLAPDAPFIPEIWQGHVNNGEGFWVALDRLEEWF
ncbi:N-acetylneuraminate synthase [Bowdeniella nasicola]|uniref:N-acetylneuraminate synthase n=1 Tax=Bowdeniella nasicola TaxID=208480 RepID=A0A1H4BIV2_9ACTO|nr:N-acetylneuraminate synthase family protein [Bowdeniella nasicola]SEA48050.1 N-acetylneuraminate synthase [Bowdeniella nasicola]